jgi:hypothetical protein
MKTAKVVEQIKTSEHRKVFGEEKEKRRNSFELAVASDEVYKWKEMKN